MVAEVSQFKIFWNFSKIFQNFLIKLKDMKNIKNLSNIIILIVGLVFLFIYPAISFIFGVIGFIYFIALIISWINNHIFKLYNKIRYKLEFSDKIK